MYLISSLPQNIKDMIMVMGDVGSNVVSQTHIQAMKVDGVNWLSMHLLFMHGRRTCAHS